MKIQVLMMPADRPAYATNIENTLKNMQKTVGGHIECVKLSSGDVLVVNEEGKLQGLPVNKNIKKGTFRGDVIVGDCFICGQAGEELTDINDLTKRVWLTAARKAWED